MTATREGSNGPAQETFADELDAHIAESLKDPEFRAASEDVDHRVELVETLVALRKSLGLTQSEVAERMGVKQPTVSGFESAGSDPRLSTVQRYARAVQAHCRVVVQVSIDCDWVKPSASYEGSLSRSTHVGGDVREATWARRSSFALAG